MGGLAAVFNAISISQSTKPVQFTTVTKDIRAGDKFSTEVLDSIPVPTQFSESLKKSAIPFEDMAVLSGRTATRDLIKGELVLWVDAPVRGAQYDLQAGESVIVVDMSRAPVASIAVGESVSFRISADNESEPLEWVGPFRVVSVGAKRMLGERSEQAREIGIAVSEGGTVEANKLQSFVDRQTRGTNEKFQIRVHSGV
ncbi:hypothetical protein [Rosistilla carotiformis]|uniref:hypothetical protein n=1 Tax=Rosistilla carotiformis TaxID=2528017 RepID=UPI0011A57504|nr:hypothetical protein [Rosistilla carotiformis]